MSDPKRWLDDPELSDALKHTLRGASRAPGLDHVTRARVGVRLGRLGAAPLSAVAWLSLKSAAALGLASGATLAGTLAVVQHYRPPHEPVSVPESAARRAHTTGGHTERAPLVAEHAPELAPQASEPPVAAASPALNPPTELPRVERVISPSLSASSVGGLAAESALLEQARQALDSAPDRALRLVREHAERFPSGQLRAERRLLEVEALYRVGRRSQAQSLARELLARGGDDLYVGRVERLLRKMGAAQ